MSRGIHSPEYHGAKPCFPLTPPRVKFSIHIYFLRKNTSPFFPKVPEKPGKSAFLNEKSGCFHMRGDGSRILHGKSYRSKLSPPFAREYSDFSVYPTRRFLPHFSGFHPFSGRATPSIHFGKTIAHFVSPLSMSLSHLGTIGTFFPARISFMISSVSSCRQNRLRM